MRIEQYKEKGLKFDFGKEGFRNGIYFLKEPLSVEDARRKGAEAISVLKKLKAGEGNIKLAGLSTEMREAFFEGAILADYTFDKYRKKEEESREVVLYVDEREGLDTALKIGEVVYFVRDIINDSPENINPESFSEIAKSLKGVDVFVGDEKWLKENGFNGTIAVGKGSSKPPRVVIYRYKPDKPAGKIVLVGKGVTFDSGGLHLKPAKSIKGMHMDMSGAAAVLGIAKAIEHIKFKYEIVGIMPLAENLPSSKSYKPSDVVEMANGKTVEVDNTDAEGRLLLADALIYSEKENPDLVVDLATLTGAAVVALGELVAALYSREEEDAREFEMASKRTGEYVWRMPLFEDYKEELKSKRADIKNAGYGRSGGSIMAALFLGEFIELERWVHLDIAGPAMLSKPFYYMPEGGTGFGVRLLIQYLRGEK